jgi:hypothetical protein
MKPSTDLMIVTFQKDFVYLRHCLLSISKFASGFSGVRLLVPNEDVSEAWALVDKTNTRKYPVVVDGYEEKPGKGFLWHERQITYADTWSGADVIAHLDSDCIFVEPITPSYFFHDGKIILRYEPFVSICKRHEAMLRWQECCTKCLPFVPKNECMRAHPHVYWRGTYKLTRDAIEKKVKTSVDDYILSCENSFPQTYAEFNTIGNVAMELDGERYHCVRQQDDVPTPPNKLQQFWGHGNIDHSQHIWVKGKQEHIIPIHFIERVLKSNYVPTPEEEARMAE